MEMLIYLIPASLILGGAGLAAFLWALRSRQFEDPEGDAQRILGTDWDNRPKPAAPNPAGPKPAAPNPAGPKPAAPDPARPASPEAATRD